MIQIQGTSHSQNTCLFYDAFILCMGEAILKQLSRLPHFSIRSARDPKEVAKVEESFLMLNLARQRRIRHVTCAFPISISRYRRLSYTHSRCYRNVVTVLHPGLVLFCTALRINSHLYIHGQFPYSCGIKNRFFSLLSKRS